MIKFRYSLRSLLLFMISCTGLSVLLFLSISLNKNQGDKGKLIASLIQSVSHETDCHTVGILWECINSVDEGVYTANQNLSGNMVAVGKTLFVINASAKNVKGLNTIAVFDTQGRGDIFTVTELDNIGGWKLTRIKKKDFEVGIEFSNGTIAKCVWFSGTTPPSFWGYFTSKRIEQSGTIVHND